MHAPAPAPFTHREVVVILIGLMIGMSLAVLDATILGAALPKIAAELNAGEDISWVVSIYLLLSTAATPIYGKLSDLYGRRLILQTAIVIFVIASIFCALSATLAQLIVLRGLQAIGGAGLLVMAHVTIADVTSPRERGRYQVFPAGVWLIGGMLGPVLGGLFADHLTWRWIFWINLPIGVIAFAFVHVTLRKLPRRQVVRHRIDYLGGVLLVSCICCILLATTLGGNELAWNSFELALLGAGALVLGLLTVIQERRAQEPLLPPRLFRNKVFVISNFSTAFAAVQFIGLTILTPVYFQLGYGLSAASSGLMMFTLSVAAPISSTFAARLMTRTGRYKMLPIAGAALSTVALVLFAFSGQGTPLWLLEVYFGLLGVGGGCANVALMIALQNALPGRDLGSGTAAMSIFRNIGAAVGVAVFSTIVISHMNGLSAVTDALGPTPGVTLLHAGAYAIEHAPAALREIVAASIIEAFRGMFLTAAAVGVVTMTLGFFLPELPLSTSVGGASRDES